MKSTIFSHRETMLHAVTRRSWKQLKSTVRAARAKKRSARCAARSHDMVSVLS